MHATSSTSFGNAMQQIRGYQAFYPSKNDFVWKTLFGLLNWEIIMKCIHTLTQSFPLYNQHIKTTLHSIITFANSSSSEMKHSHHAAIYIRKCKLHALMVPKVLRKSTKWTVFRTQFQRKYIRCFWCFAFWWAPIEFYWFANFFASSFQNKQRITLQDVY